MTAALTDLQLPTNPVAAVLVILIFIVGGFFSNGAYTKLRESRRKDRGERNRQARDMSEWADLQAEKWVKRHEALVERYERENREIREDLAAVHDQIERHAREKRALVGYIYVLLAWANSQPHITTVPPIPDDVQHIIDTDPVNG